MQEPDWNEIGKDPKYARMPRKDDIVWITKKTRGRFPEHMPTAIPGDYGIVLSQWTSSMGSVKLCILTHDQREIGTTATCARIFSTLVDARENEKNDKWSSVKLAWMNRTYVPIIVMRKKQQRKKRRYRGGTLEFIQGTGVKYVASRDGTAVLVSAINSDSKVWLNADKVHPEDWAEMMKSSEQCHSVRVPQWVAKKSGLF